MLVLVYVILVFNKILAVINQTNHRNYLILELECHLFHLNQF